MGYEITMIDNHLQKYKFAFIAIIGSIITMLVLSIAFMKGSTYIKEEYMWMGVQYVKYKASVIFATRESLAATLNPFDKEAMTAEHAQNVPVLLYHGIIDRPDGSNVLLRDFEEQMLALYKAGWRTITLEEFYKFRKGEITLPDRSFLLTFDDGRKDSYYPADPILKALGYNAVMFVITGFSLNTEESKYYIGTEELRHMIKSGRWEVQSHGKHDHEFYEITPLGARGLFLTNKKWLSNEGRMETDEEYQMRIETDLRESKKELEETFGITIVSFAFPYGDFGQGQTNVEQAEAKITRATASIYPISFYQFAQGVRFTANMPDNTSFFAKRIDVNPEWRAEDLIEIMEKGRIKKLPFSDEAYSNKGWITTWGERIQREHKVVLRAENSTGAAMILDGSGAWENYEVRTTIRWTKGNSFFLWARYKDDDNYVSCNFTRDFTHIEEVIQGATRVARGALGVTVSDQEFEIGMRVQGRTAMCTVNGVEMVRTEYLTPERNNGGIGIKIWDPMMNNAEAEFYGLKVYPLGEGGES